MTFIHTHESSGKKYTFYDKKLSSNTNNIFTILVGKNGSGKSTILNILNYLLSDAKNGQRIKYDFDELDLYLLEEKGSKCQNTKFYM